jgi:hypothetical protein
MATRLLLHANMTSAIDAVKANDGSTVTFN